MENVIKEIMGSVETVVNVKKEVADKNTLKIGHVQNHCQKKMEKVICFAGKQKEPSFLQTTLSNNLDNHPVPKEKQH